ncbi:MAG TPA: hypothetical protein P5107_00685 [Thermotogota bacterium]|nr:hypothetical protein [Thermotogota bacterium]
MKSALEVMTEIENISKKIMELIKTGKYELLASNLDIRSEMITSLAHAKSTDREAERSVLRRVEKLESEMLEMLKNLTHQTKHSIDQVSVGKRAVKNGYFKSKNEYEQNNRFSKRG